MDYKTVSKYFNIAYKFYHKKLRKYAENGEFHSSLTSFSKVD